MSGFLDRMAEASRSRVKQAKTALPEPALLERACQSPAPLPLRLGVFDVIAELKLRSPAAGVLAATDFEPEAQVCRYARDGAAAVSVLTEPTEFNGTLEHLESAAAALRPLGCPVMRKDFLTSAYQVVEARASGASGVLVIVTMLSDAEVSELLAAARELELFVLLEAFDRPDLERVVELTAGSGPDVLAGVNCRDLKSLQVDFERFEQLADYLPPGRPTVAESGVERSADIERLARLGYRLALVGSALMRAATSVGDLIAAGRAGVQKCS